MKALRYILMLMLTLAVLRPATAQLHNNVIIQNNHITVQMDTRSPKRQIDSILNIAGINNITAEMVIRGNFNAAERDGWKVRIRKKFIVEMNVSMSKLGENRITPYLISTTINKSITRPGYPAEVLYGINRFNRVTVHELPSGLTRFFVPGNTNAKRVILSGSFNNWSTIKGLMNRTDSGWVADISLEPGKYAYKFIINGNWSADINNRLLENDGTGNDNSIYFRYNYTFRLTGYNSARRVNVTGSFNKWKTDELPMFKNGGSWELKMYIHDGIHLYRFMVDGKWVADPANSNTQYENNIPTSILKLGEIIRFKLSGYTTAKKVYLSGSFNNWDPDMILMQRTASGWELSYTLPAGNYLYKFVVDGQLITDPLNPHQITEDGKTNSFLTVKPNYTFRLKGYGNARKVILPGTFNNWNESGYTMEHRGDEWVISIRLKPGKYLYKFLIDGNKWIIDPGNKQWEQNEFDTGNSVIWIE